MDVSTACRTCKGAGRVDDVRVESITHRVTPVRRKCRACDGSGERPEPPMASCEERGSGEIPTWMLGWESD